MTADPRAYVVIEAEVQNPEAYAEYVRLSTATHAAFGGRFLVRGGNAQALEEDWSPRRLVIIEFPNRQAANDWYRSPAYQDARKARVGAARFRATVVEGVPAP